MSKGMFLGLVAVFLCSIGVLLWALQSSGIFDVMGHFQPVMARLPFVGYTLAEERLTPEELRKRELERIQESIMEKEKVLANKELELSERENSLKTENEILEQRRRQIREIEVKLAEQEKLENDRDRRINRLVEIYSAMPPEAAAKQLELQEDNMVVDILGRMKPDVVSILLSRMSLEHSASLTLKMGKPESLTQ